jgi:hypothetical protein
MIEIPDEDEATAIEAIKLNLLTEEQRRWLFDNGLDVADILNGRFGGSLEDDANAIFAEWNAKLGRREFGF